MGLVTTKLWFYVLLTHKETYKHAFRVKKPDLSLDYFIIYEYEDEGLKILKFLKSKLKKREGCTGADSKQGQGKPKL